MIGVAVPTAAVPDLRVLARTTLEVTDLRVRYERATSLALDGVSVAIPEGARVALVGANGSGKSTLLKAIVGLVPVQSGSIRIGGASASDSRRRVAYLPQVGELDWRFPVSVERLVVTGRYVHLAWWQRPVGATSSSPGSR